MKNFSPPEPGRVLVAMSGGVDSSVAAARLVAAGHEVVGVTLHLWDYPDDGSVKGRCCAPEDQHDARRVADRLGIAHYAFDRRSEFTREVVEPFVEAYLSGETPSPCVACNRGVKTRELFALADRLGAAWVATGHYARVLRAGTPPDPVLATAVDESKDQSYFLHMLTKEQLGRLVLPLGEATKTETRAEALALGLPGATKGESQELCFIPTGRYDAFVEQRADGRIRPGRILDATGREVGQHGGVHRFTVGQRKGLGVALGERAFVVGVDAATATVQLGPPEALGVRRIEVEHAEFRGPLPASARFKVRARHEGAEAKVKSLGEGRIELRFEAPVRGVAVGQYAVAYEGAQVLGGGRIARVDPAPAAAEVST